MLTWGWASELYLDFDWTPRESLRERHVAALPQPIPEPMERVMLRELQRKPPDCIVEALGPDFFAEVDTSRTIGSMIAGMQPLLESCYAESSARTLDDKPVTLYRRVAACSDD